MKNFERSLQISINNYRQFGRLYFTPKQLFYEFCRTVNLPILAKISGLIKISKTLETPILFCEFEDLLNRYWQMNEIKELLKLQSNIYFNTDLPNDLTLYGLPKILVCESNEIAQMLRANQFHLQTPCAVLSLEEANPLARNFHKMLANAESPQVYFLHDASFKAYSILQNLRQTLSLAENIPLRPLGLRPIHAQRLNLFAQKVMAEKVDLNQFSFLTEGEKQWLETNWKAEISAVSPVRLMRILRRLILDIEIPPSLWQVKLPGKKLGFM
jgi:hypothetical protein